MRTHSMLALAPMLTLADYGGTLNFRAQKL
jgi:hypothetical protein